MFFCCTCNITEISHFLWCITVFRHFFVVHHFILRWTLFVNVFFIFRLHSVCDLSQTVHVAQMNALMHFGRNIVAMRLRFSKNLLISWNKMKEDEPKKISNYVNMNQTKRRINHTSTQAHIHGAHWSKVQTKPTRTFSLSFRWPYRAILYSVSILYELRLCRAFFFT